MATKASVSTGVSSSTVSAGSATNTLVSSTIDLTTQDAAIITAQVTNGASAPGSGCVVQVMHSADGGTTYQIIDIATAGLVASTTYSFRWTYGPEVGKIQLWFGQNTTNSVTATAQCFAASAL